jgi:hypothetical protein
MILLRELAFERLLGPLVRRMRLARVAGTAVFLTAETGTVGDDFFEGD